MQRELGMRIREGKAGYRSRMENQLQLNNVNGVWRGLRTISVYTTESITLRKQAVGK